MARRKERPPNPHEQSFDVSQIELAQLLGRTSRTVAHWTEEGLPRNRNGSYPLGRCIRWALERAEGLHAGQTVVEARRRHELAQAELAELELAKRRGEQVAMADVLSEFGRLAGTIRAILLAAPGKHAHKLLGARSLAEAQGVLEDVVREILANLKSVMLDGDQPTRVRAQPLPASPAKASPVPTRGRPRGATRRGRGRAVQPAAQAQRQ